MRSHLLDLSNFRCSTLDSLMTGQKRFDQILIQIASYLENRCEKNSSILVYFMHNFATFIITFSLNNEMKPIYKFQVHAN